MKAARVQAVLFDLDGTLVDSAPDMARALNAMLVVRGMAALPVSQVRPHVTRGARGMLAVGFGLTPDDADYNVLRDEFHARYERDICIDSRCFDGIGAVVGELRRRGIPWGIVTNKAARFALPLTRALGIDSAAACLVCGDTTPHTKPHPAPLLHAATLLKVSPLHCLYLGDDLRDMQAANAAGMTAVAACYGYLAEDADPALWNAAHLIDQPTQLLAVLD